ncbi:MAG: phenylacetate-CoA oxygenase subunit PaaJ [Parvularculaceae bacterium]
MSAETKARDAQAIWTSLAEVMDPEVPVLSVLDLGVVRNVRIDEKGAAEIVVTPTYSGCPATEAIERLIRERLEKDGWRVRLETRLAPPWTTDWLSDAAREKLRAYGIAPPQGSPDKRSLAPDRPAIVCPRCGSQDTECVSEFGSTACKALYKCRACLEPFEYFKCL